MLIFSSTIFDYKTIATRLKESAYLIRGLRIELIDLRTDKQETFTLKTELSSLLKQLLAVRILSMNLLFSQVNVKESMSK